MITILSLLISNNIILLKTTLSNFQVLFKKRVHLWFHLNLISPH